MITEAKNLLENVVKKRIKDVTVVRSAQEESQSIMGRKFPLVALITNPGPFDESEARTVRYLKNETNMFQQRYVRGARNLPILLRCWAQGEAEADKVFSRIIPAIPSRWDYDDFTGSIEINVEEHSDHTGNVAKLYLSVAVIIFKVPVAVEEKDIPTYEKVMIDGEIRLKKEQGGKKINVQEKR